MKILHVSDWHGNFSLVPKILELSYDMVVMSGDMVANCSRSRGSNEVSQPKWLRENKSKFDELIGSRPFLYCEGNHDFVDPTPIIGGININYKRVEVLGVSFYGVPAIPSINWEWNHEVTVEEMFDISKSIPNDIDVLVCHCPLNGLLDMPGLNDNVLSNRYYYNELDWPKAILCGHHHETYGMIEYCGCKVSNAATSYNIVEV